MSRMLDPTIKASVYVASGSAHPSLAKDISDEMGLVLGPVEAKTHPNGELYARYGDSVRGKHVYIVQSHVRGASGSVNDAIMQQCLLADAARSSSAAEITAVCPYLAYTRQDRKSRGREPIGARVLIDHLVASGVTRIVTVDMHSAQTQAIFRGPFDHLTAQPLLRQAMEEVIAGHDRKDCLVVAPDAGAAKLAERHRQELGTGLLHLTKSRDRIDSGKITRDQHVPEAAGKVCLVFDDMIDTASTLVSAAEALKNSGATAIYVAATHGVFSGQALEKLKAAPIDRLIVTDTFPMDEAQNVLGAMLQVVPTGPMIGRALVEIMQNGSVSELFDDQNHA